MRRIDLSPQIGPQRDIDVPGEPSSGCSFALQRPAQQRPLRDGEQDWRELLWIASGQLSGIKRIFDQLGNDLLIVACHGQGDLSQVGIRQIHLKVGQVVGHFLRSRGHAGETEQVLAQGAYGRGMFATKLIDERGRIGLGVSSQADEEATLGAKALYERGGGEATLLGHSGEGEFHGPDAADHFGGGAEDLLVGDSLGPGHLCLRVSIFINDHSFIFKRSAGGKSSDRGTCPTNITLEAFMRRIRYGVAMSLDGYIAGPNDEFDWILMDPDIDFGEMYSQFDTLLIGRRTFEVTRRYQGDSMGESMPGMRSIVFSRTLKQADYPDVTIVGDDWKQTVESLLHEPGKDIWLFGGGSLFRSLAAEGLVDTVEVGVIPILLGGGIPLLPPSDTPIKLKLTKHKVLKTTGTVGLEYEVEKAG